MSAAHDICEWVTEAGRCLDCGARMWSIGGLPAVCDCDEPPIEDEEVAV